MAVGSVCPAKMGVRTAPSTKPCVLAAQLDSQLVGITVCPVDHTPVLLVAATIATIASAA